MIADGIHRYIRHPNYLGEMMVYGAFAMMVWHFIAWVIVGLVWLLIFIPNMVTKEHSLSRHSVWQEYKKSSGWVLPFL